MSRERVKESTLREGYRHVFLEYGNSRQQGGGADSAGLRIRELGQEQERNGRRSSSARCEDVSWLGIHALQGLCLLSWLMKTGRRGTVNSFLPVSSERNNISSQSHHQMSTSLDK